MEEIKQAIQDRKESLKKYNNDLYLIAKCLESTQVQYLFNQLTQQPNIFLNSEDIKSIEKIILEIIKIVKQEIIKNFLSQKKKAA